MPAPRRPMSASSEDGDVDGAAERELEYQRLQKKYRTMENDRQKYSTESQEFIRKQRYEITKLEKDQEEVKKNLKLIESRSNQSRDEHLTEELEELGRKNDETQSEIEEEKRKQQELDAKIREEERKSRDQNRNMGGTNMSVQHQKKTQKGIRTLESRLDLAQKRFNRLCKENEHLRKEIDDLRVSRRRFDDLYKKVDEQQEQLKLEIGQIVEQSTQAYEQRDEAQQKMIALQEKAEKDRQQHNAEMKELIRFLDHDRRLRVFMNTKGRDRPEDQQMMTWREKERQRDAEKQKANQVDTVESYDEAMTKIKQITNMEDLNEIVDKFIAVEDKNFALFKYVNEQNAEVEMLQEKILEIKREIADFEAKGVAMEKDRQVILKQLEQRQTAAAQSGDNADKNYKAVLKVLDQLRTGVESLFKKINCDSEAVEDLLSGSQGCTEQNLMQYLGLIEERCNQMLLCKLYLDKHKERQRRLMEGDVTLMFEEGALKGFGHNKALPFSLLGRGPESHPPLPHVVPPAVRDEFDSDGSEGSDDENRPMTREELKKRAMKAVKKREHAAAKDTRRYDLEVDNKGKNKKRS